MKKKLAILLASLMIVSSFAACSSDTVDEDTSGDSDTSVSTDAEDEDETAEEDTLVYATMNIPYADFYSAELDDNNFEVDAVTSATTSKWMNYDYTYFAELEDGSGGGTIFGPKYPVLISEELFDELSALGESEDYYVTELDEEPAAYKEVTGEVGSLVFSEMIGTDTVSDATYEMEVGSNWGDYEIMVTGLPDDMSTIYGVEVVTDSGKSYGLRTLENIWSNGKEISWSFGYKTLIKSVNTISSEQYIDMQGQTITSVSYYVPEGTVTVEMDLYVPYLYCETLFTIGEISGNSGYVDLADLTASIDYVEGVEIPDDLEIELTATLSGEVVDGITISDDFTSINWTEDVTAGSYTIEISDANGVYMPYSKTVVFQTDILPVSFDEDTLSFTADNGASEDEVATFLASLSKYTVTAEGEEEGTSYSISENHGTPGTPLLTDDGTIDLEAVNSDEEALYEAGVTYTIEFTVTGYTAYTFTFTA